MSIIIWMAVVLAVLMPAVLVAKASGRRLALLLLLWFVSPVFVYAGVIIWETLTRPGTTYQPGTALYGFMLISPILTPPWALACLLGCGVGYVLRRLFRPRGTG